MAPTQLSGLHDNDTWQGRFAGGGAGVLDEPGLIEEVSPWWSENPVCDVDDDLDDDEAYFLDDDEDDDDDFGDDYDDDEFEDDEFEDDSDDDYDDDDL